MTQNEHRAVELSANRSQLLSDADRAFVVEEGHVLLFAVELEQNEPTGQRHLLADLEPGDLLMGSDLGAGLPLALTVTGAGPARIVPVDLAQWGQRASREDAEAVSAIESWITALSARVARNRRMPSELGVLEEGAATLRAGAATHPDLGVRFVSVHRGLVAFAGLDAAVAGPDDPPLALSDESWLSALDDSEIVAVTTSAALAQDWGIAALRGFTRLALRALGDEVAALVDRRRQEAERLADSDLEHQDRAVQELAGVLSRPSRVSTHAQSRDPAIAAVQAVLAEMGLPAPGLEAHRPHLEQWRAPGERVAIAARLAGARTRSVALSSRWWMSDLGPLIGYRGEDGQPVALLRAWNGYQVYEPATQSLIPLDATGAARLAAEAVALYRPLSEEARGIGELIRAGLRGSRLDVLWLVVFGSFAGAASLVTPVLTGTIFNQVIPADQRGRLGIAVLTLGLVAVSVAFGSLARGVAFIRIRARFSNHATSALWDRLLRLPAGFFSQHLVGTLSNRARALEMAQQILTDSIVATVLNGIFSLFNLALLGSAGGTLLLVGIGLVVVQLLIIAVTTLVQTTLTRSQIAAQNRAQSLSLQLIRGINKLRVASAERRGFATWAHRFGDQSRAAYRSGRLGAGLAVFTTGWSSLTTLAVTGVVAASGLGLVSVGSFIEYTTALAQVTTALTTMVAGLGTLAVVVPLLELPTPILEGRVESGGGREQPGELSGAVEVSHVSFRYSDDGPLVLDDVSLEAAPGEFVAIVGPSGAGKSSLVRLLLGFEVPELGSVAYDGRDLSTLDTTAVRRQIGTVIQSARLLPGTIYSNIAGGLPITRDEAWAAAEAAGVAEDIRTMPMGMETVIVEGGSVVSGGQRQRILIARALALRPRILLFDEATSALDNVTQAIVTSSVARLQVTRLVIAHRLSTVQGADRIYVLQRGKVVEVGRYEELMERDGVFRRLAQRQLV